MGSMFNILGQFTPSVPAGAGDIATGVGTAAAVFLVGAFSVGAGFKIAKKGYGWVMGKIG